MDLKTRFQKACLTILSTWFSGGTSTIAGSSQRRSPIRPTTSLNLGARSQQAWLTERLFQSQRRSSMSDCGRHAADRTCTSRKVGILSIQRGQFIIEPIPLKTVRPFKIGDIVLEEEADDEENGIDLQKRETITAFLKTKVRVTAQKRFLQKFDNPFCMAGRGTDQRSRGRMEGVAPRLEGKDDVAFDSITSETIGSHPASD